MGSDPQALRCPYCGQPLRWVAHRWFTRGCYHCDRCGDFPDLHEPAATQGPYTDTTAHVPATKDDRLRILLVDDSKEHRDLYAVMLEATATVLTAARGEDALTIAASEPLDAIVLDVLMPGMSGWEVCLRLKANPQTANIPVIVLTSLDGTDAATPGHRVGAAAVLMKPCPIERLARTVEAVVSRGTTQKTPPYRRWVRKTMMPPMYARVGQSVVQVLNVSYGGLCVKIAAPAPRPLTASVDVTFPAAHEMTIHADVVWVTDADEDGCLCGARIRAVTDDWRALVDTVAH